MKLILNIGLDGVPVDLSYTNGVLNPVKARRAIRAMRALRGKGLWPTSNKVVESDSEPTLVVECDFLSNAAGNATPAQAAYQIAVELNQACVALWDLERQSGRLIGPHAAAWGHFNPEFFFLPNGQRLASPVATA